MTDLKQTAEQISMDEISDEQINSACLSYRHDFGLLPELDKDDLRRKAKWWLEAWRKALPDRLSALSPRVKALEWSEAMVRGKYIAIAPLIGRYVADAFPGSGKPGWKAPGPDEDWRMAETIDEAKAAAQADFERRILSAIEVSASPRMVTDEEVERAASQLMQYGLNAPESTIYAAAKAALTATLSSAEEKDTGLSKDQMPKWPPLKKALWSVVTGEALNDGHYINAYDLTDKLYAAISSPHHTSADKLEVVGWIGMDEAPKDGTLLHLLVSPDDEAHTSFHDSEVPYETIGFNQFGDTGIDEWQFAGWDWSHDCITQGYGEVIGWLPFHAAPSNPVVSDKIDARLYHLHVEALAEIKATVDGESDQPVKDIIYGSLDEIAALSVKPSGSNRL